MSELRFFSAKENDDNECEDDRRKHNLYHHASTWLAKMQFRLPPQDIGLGGEYSCSNAGRPKILGVGGEKEEGRCHKV